MRAFPTILAAAGAIGLMAAASVPARADWDHHDHGWHHRDWDGGWQRGWYRPRVYVPPAVVYRPPPRVYYAPPYAYYAPPAYYAAPGVTFGFTIR